MLVEEEILSKKSLYDWHWPNSLEDIFFLKMVIVF